MIKNKFSKIALAAMVTFMVASPTAMAAGTTAGVGANVQVDPGTLEQTIDTSTLTFRNVLLQDLLTINYNDAILFPSLNVTDATGSNAGWKVQYSATQAIDAVTSEVLPADLLSLDNSALAADKGTFTMGNTKQVLTTTPATMISAAADNGDGMGSFNFAGAELEADIASSSFADIEAGQYATVVSVDLVATP